MTSAPRGTSSVVWERIGLPDGSEAVALAAEAGAIVVGGYRTGGPPSMYVVAADGAPRAVTVTPDPSSPYAPLARWQSIALRDGAITAIGGAAGGAHSNTRWTTWAGESGVAAGGRAGSVRERPQLFYAFGGYGAGGLLDAVATAAGTYLVGTWNGTTGLDAAIWRQRGLRWERAESAGTALASSPTELVGAQAAASTGPGILIAGNVTTLRAGVRRSAAVWRSTRGAQDWHRIDLPDSGSSSAAGSATCAVDGCVVAGLVDGRFALWWLPTQGGPSRLTGLPELVVADRDALPAPVRSAAMPPAQGAPRLGDLVAVVGDVVIARSEGSWTTYPVPGRARAIAAAGESLYVIATGPGSAGSLWRGRMTSS